MKCKCIFEATLHQDGTFWFLYWGINPWLLTLYWFVSFFFFYCALSVIENRGLPSMMSEPKMAATEQMMSPDVRKRSSWHKDSWNWKQAFKWKTDDQTLERDITFIFMQKVLIVWFVKLFMWSLMTCASTFWLIHFSGLFHSLQATVRHLIVWKEIFFSVFIFQMACMITCWGYWVSSISF